MRASGSMTSNMDTVLKVGLMVLVTRVNTLRARRKEMVV
jgi:hypothetical protein